MKDISADISALQKLLLQIPYKAGSLAVAIAASLPVRPDQTTSNRQFPCLMVMGGDQRLV
jgi:hypothetical protein